MKIILKTISIIILLCLSSLAGETQKTVEVHLKLSPAVSDQPLTGRVYLLVRLDIYSHPLDGPSFSEEDPFFALDVKDWQPGEEIVMTDKAPGYPYSLSNLPVATCIAQAILDTNTVERDFADIV